MTNLDMLCFLVRSSVYYITTSFLRFELKVTQRKLLNHFDALKVDLKTKWQKGLNHLHLMLLYLVSATLY